MEEHCTIEDVAGRLGISLKLVRRFVASGQLPATRSGGKYVIEKRAADAFAAKYVTDNGDGSTTILQDSGPCLPGMEDYVRTEIRVAAPGPGPKRADDVNWVDISGQWDAPPPSRMTFVDLFCGAGGLSKGLEMSGMQGVCGLDWFEEAGRTYSRNFDHPFVNGDITRPEVKRRFYETVKERLAGRELDLVAGGFPCQGFSMAGNRIVDDPRNSLYKELVEIVRTLRPRFVVCENVKGLRSMLDGRVERKILDDFAEIGYRMAVTTLCAADYHTPQKRERVIFVGNRIGAENFHPRPLLRPEEYVTTGQAIGDLMSHPCDPGFNHEPTRHRADMVERMRALPEGQSLYKGYSDAWKKCPWDEASCTIKENHGGVNIHPRLPRVLTAREMARLQSFPDDFIFMGRKNKQLVQIGNAVPPLLGKAIGLAVRHSAGDLAPRG